VHSKIISKIFHKNFNTQASFGIYNAAESSSQSLMQKCVTKLEIPEIPNSLMFTKAFSSQDRWLSKTTAFFRSVYETVFFLLLCSPDNIGAGETSLFWPKGSII
jgi:hypothetical protein